MSSTTTTSTMGTVDIILFIAIPIITIPVLVIIIRLLRQIIKGKDAGRKAIKSSTSVRERLSLFMFTSTIGRNWTLIQITATFFAVSLYVLETYIGQKLEFMFVLEIALSCLFAADYILFFYLAPDKFRYSISIFALIDLVTVLPVIANVLFDTSSTDTNFLRPLRVLRAMRIMRAYRVLNFSKTVVVRQIGVVLLTVISLIFMTSGLVQVIEAQQELSFHNSVYFLIVTMTTVGYGDISPKTDLGRVTMALMIVVTYIMMPVQISKLISLLNKQGPYSGRFKKSDRVPHVVVCGEVTHDNVSDFLREFYHEEHSAGKWNVVILGTSEPSFELKAKLMIPFYQSRVRFILGSPTVKDDLDRAKYDQAHACFVFSDKFSDDSVTDDAQTIMRSLSVKSTYPSVPVYAQIIRRESIQALLDAGAEYVLCTEEMRLQMMGQSVFSPGFCTLITNLVRSYSNRSRVVDSAHPWKSEYFDGCTTEIYTVEFSDWFVGMSFSEAAAIIFQKFGVVLVGVSIPVSECGGEEIEIAKDKDKDKDKNATRSRSPENRSQDHDEHSFSREFLGGASSKSISKGKNVSLSSLIKSQSSVDEAWGDILLNPGRLFKIKESNMALVLANSEEQTIAIRDYHEAFTWRDLNGDGDENAENAESGGVSAMESGVGGVGLNATEGESDGMFGALTVGMGSTAAAVKDAKQERRQKESKAKIAPSSTGLFGTLASKIMRVKGHPSHSTSGHVHPHQTRSRRDSLRTGQLPSNLSLVSQSRRRGDVALVSMVGKSKEKEKEKEAEDKGVRFASGAGSMSTSSVSAASSVSEEKDTRKLRMLRRQMSSELHIPVSKTPRVKGRSLADSTLERVDFQNHVIYCGPTEGIGNFIGPLRVNENSIIPIVILTADPPSPGVWRVVSRYAEVYYVAGSPLVWDDLERAGVHSATTMVLLTDMWRRGLGPNRASLRLDAQQADASTILVAHTVDSRAPEVKVKLVEIALAGNTSVLYYSRSSAEAERNTVRFELKSGEKQWSAFQSTGTDIPTYQLSPHFAAGRVFTSSVLDSLLCQAFWNPALAMVVQDMVVGTGPAKSDVDTYRSRVYQTAIPSVYIGSSFSTLFHDCVHGHVGFKNRCILPFAFLRTQESTGHQYVHTNPERETVLRESDLLFVLSQIDPGPQLHVVDVGQGVDDKGEDGQANGEEDDQKSLEYDYDTISLGDTISTIE